MIDYIFNDLPDLWKLVKENISIPDQKKFTKQIQIFEHDNINDIEDLLEFLCGYGVIKNYIDKTTMNNKSMLKSRLQKISNFRVKTMISFSAQNDMNKNRKKNKYRLKKINKYLNK